MRNFIVFAIIGLIFTSCIRQGQANVPQKNIEPRIYIKKDGIEIKKLFDLPAYSNYDIIVNDIYNARLLRKPDITKGDSINIPYNSFNLPAGSVIKSVTFRMPNYNDYTITQELEPCGDLLDFIGIQWGSDIQTTRLILEQRGYTEIRVTDMSVPSRLDDERLRRAREAWVNQKYISAKGDFAGYSSSEISEIKLHFYKDKFYHAEVSISRHAFDNLYRLISEKYWDTILSTTGMHPLYTWIFDNNYFAIIP